MHVGVRPAAAAQPPDLGMAYAMDSALSRRNLCTAALTFVGVGSEKDTWPNAHKTPKSRGSHLRNGIGSGKPIKAGKSLLLSPPAPAVPLRSHRSAGRALVRNRRLPQQWLLMCLR